MKDRKLVSWFIFIIFILAGCGAPPAPSTEPPATPIVIIVTATSIAPIEPSPTTASAALPQPQAQPQSQPTLILAPTLPVSIANGSGPFASPKGVTLNCRGGPDVRWPVGAILNPGENVEIVGRNSDSTWWYVKNPSVPAGACWIFADFATVTGNTSSVQVVVVTGAPPVNGTTAGVITSVNITLEPNEIDDPGCFGPYDPIHILAKIGTNGAVYIKFHFEAEQVGMLRDHELQFDHADIQDVSDSFVPYAKAGTYRVILEVEDMDLQGLAPVATYKINC